MAKINVLMVGPARDVKGGMTTVVDQYYECGLDKKVNLKYIESVNDKNIFSKIIKMIKGYCEFKRCISDFDVVHIHVASDMSTYRKNKYVQLAKIYKKKVIIHVHGAEYKRFYNECNDKNKNKIIDMFDKADNVIVLSEEWKEFFSTFVESNKISVIYNAIVIPDEFEKKLDNKDLLFLGRFGERKGIYDLLEVISNLKNEYPDIKLYAGGDGEIDKVNYYINEHNLSNNVINLGWVSGDKKTELLKKCSIYILPSYNEGMPMSLIEGMAYGNVGISTNVGGIPKVITDKVNGFLITPGDKDSMYECLKKLFDNPDIKEKMAYNGRKTVSEKFNINNNIKLLLDLYK